ncbi:MAG: hypothetical protein FWE21_05980 [Defluviitaleaceae bacterium]|nr:hypothetical protein [Defluviitaleaceae bacterium]
MKKIRNGLYIAGLCGAMVAGAVLGGNTGLTGSTNPGSQQDPLVTRSYVNQAIHRALQDFEPSSSSGIAFSPVHVTAGHVILGEEGSVIILRSGAATAHVPGTDGIVNTSMGVDMFHGYQIITNHYLIIPRDDGRGVHAATDAWFLVQGGFQIVALP